MSDWLDSFAPLAALDAPARAALAALPTLNFAKGKVLFAPGAACQGFVLLLEGRIRSG
jgi:CRP/FNR family transcriptional regulator, anaerobic regulatory protein